MEVEVAHFQLEHLTAPHPGEEGQQEHVGHVAHGPFPEHGQKALGLLRLQVFNDLVILDGHFNLKAQGRAAIGLVAEVDDAPEQLKDIPHGGGLTVAQGLAQFLNNLGRDLTNSTLAAEREQVVLITIFVGDNALERRAFDFKISVTNFLKGAVLFALLPAYLFGGFDFFTVPHSLDALGADFRRHFRAIAFGDSADFFPDQASARTEVDVEAEVW